MAVLPPAPALAASHNAGPDGAAIHVNWPMVAPGDEVLLAGGDYHRPFVVRGRGDPLHPIIVRALPGARPILHNSVVVEGASDIVLEGLEIDGAEHSGVIIRQGSTRITVRGVSVRNSGLGIWIGDGAGSGHQLTGNRLHDNRTHGIAVDRINAAPEAPTRIASNDIYRNGVHGIEISGNNYLILNNQVHENGQLTSGASGIHIYCDFPPDYAYGRRNIVNGNISYANKDISAQDGNGIQADQFCDETEISFNIVFANDGGGIVLYDAARSSVFNNTLIGNMLDPGASHVYKGELILASDYTKNIDNTQGSLAVNNIIVAEGRAVHAVVVDTLTTDNAMTIGNNLLYHQQGGAIYQWGSAEGSDAARWNALKRGGAPDIIADPLFAAPQTPLTGGLALRPGSPALGRGMKAAEPDATSQSAPDLGALQR